MEKLTRQEVIKKLVENDIQIIKENIEEGDTEMLVHVLTNGTPGYIDFPSEDLKDSYFEQFDEHITITD